MKSVKDNLLPLDEDTFVGVFQFARRGGLVLVDRRQFRDDILIRTHNIHDVIDGDKVVVKVTFPGTRHRKPEGVILEVLGQPGENETEMHAILAEFGLPSSYPAHLEEEAEAIPSELTEKEILRRRDFRDVLTFTIDPADAKDFDDALSFRETEDGHYEVGVHIADVTHYVAYHSGIDDEAYERGTSVYLVDRTIPMLPEKLCNNLCSLRPNEDKLTMSVIFTMTADAKVEKAKVCRTVIHSDYRLAYGQAQEILDHTEDTSPLAVALHTLSSLAQQLRKERFQHGAINFEREEVHVDLDEDKHPIGFHLESAQPSNQLIEEFMLLANRTIATQVGKMDAGKLRKTHTFVYRIHDVPDPDKLKSLSKFIVRFGYHFTPSSRRETTVKNINKILSECRGKAEQNLVETLTIRTMAKAVYTTENIGHYGLAFPYYTHFTSPIRRYPDMMVHRLVSKYILGERDTAEVKFTLSAEELEQSCKHCSDREQLAANAERASVRYKQAEYMQEHLDEEFEGFVTSVADFGMFVELNGTQCEGLVPMHEMADANDYIQYCEDDYCLQSVRTGERWTVGDHVRVRLIRADLERKKLTFSLIK